MGYLCLPSINDTLKSTSANLVYKLPILKNYKTVIIGAGFSGICMGIKLKQAGFDDFIILEKAASLGGTWRENTYPGAECDIPSALYSYSFEHNSAWKYKWSKQKQILQYQNDVATKYQLADHFSFNTEVISADYDQQQQRWLLKNQRGDELSCQHLVAAVGQLHRTSTPEFEGADLFDGAVFHSAHWNHDVPLKDKRVAVIGNAASAVQLIPEIAEQVAHLTVFQRSANWVLPKMDREYLRIEQWLSEKLSWVTKFYRLQLWLKGEVGIFPAIKGNRVSRAILRAWSLYAMKKSIKDPQLIAKLTPNFPIGAKRVLFADHYYPALARENVDLDTSGVNKFTHDGIENKEGKSKKFDVVIYATGFRTNPFLAPMKIRGLERLLLSDAWSQGAQAYLGVSTANFPNLHMMYGPNTNLGHNSIIIMIEAQAKFIVNAMSYVEENSAKSLQIPKAKEDEYNAELQARLAGLAFSDVEHSWYMDGGKVTNNWAGGTREYTRRLANVDWSDYQLG